MAGVSLKDEESIIFVLYSIHDVMKAEFALKDRGMAYDLIPVPKELSSDCGMALLVEREGREEIREVLRKNNLSIKGAYLKTMEGYEEWIDG